LIKLVYWGILKLVDIALINKIICNKTTEVERTNASQLISFLGWCLGRSARTTQSTYYVPYTTNNTGRFLYQCKLPVTIQKRHTAKQPETFCYFRCIRIKSDCPTRWTPSLFSFNVVLC